MNHVVHESIVMLVSVLVHLMMEYVENLCTSLQEEHEVVLKGTSGLTWFGGRPITIPARP